ncbi:MAG: GrpB family protein [Ignavibacteriae bacterium]|nr:GrpB family protein [Ignavibacteriota bacterium]
MIIKVEPHNPDWSRQFADESKRILAALEIVNPIIQHIGSTSVIGLSAKPIIDIMLGLTSIEELNQIIPPMQSLGYSYVSRYEDTMPYRRYFVKYSQDEHLPYIPVVDSLITNMGDVGYESFIHVHSVVIDSEFWERHLAFRDYLRHHTNERDKYGAFKLTLAQKDWQNSLEYSAAKHDFIQEMQRKAITWYRAKMK